MTISKSRLYLLLIGLCLAGHTWLWYGYSDSGHLTHDHFGLCLFKTATGFPCPACGSTRSAIALIRGEVVRSVQINPFGGIVLVGLFTIPLLIGIDKLLNRNIVYSTYIKVEWYLKKPAYMVPAIAMVIANWIWNIQKGL